MRPEASSALVPPSTNPPTVAIPDALVNGVAGAPDTLQERRDSPRRSDLTDQVDVADVDAKFQRRGRDDDAEGSGLETQLGVQAPFLRQAAVVRRH